MPMLTSCVRNLRAIKLSSTAICRAIYCITSRRPTCKCAFCGIENLPRLRIGLCAFAETLGICGGSTHWQSRTRKRGYYLARVRGAGRVSKGINWRASFKFSTVFELENHPCGIRKGDRWYGTSALARRQAEVPDIFQRYLATMG